jgi:glycerophosphoryl diester phosphodiesterase
MRVFAQPPEVVGHRGAGEQLVSGLPENSLASCLAAHDQGATWVELDARLSRDEVLVLHHDAVLADGRPIETTTTEECREQGVVSLDELLDGLPDGLGVDLEVKVALADATRPAERTTAGRVAERVRRMQGRRPAVVTSFNPAALLQARAVGGDEVPVGLLGMPVTPLGELVPGALALQARVLAPHVLSLGLVEVPGLPREPEDRVTAALDVAREHGCEILVWGVRAEQAGSVADLDVDAVCVDEIADTAAALADRRVGD